MGSDLWNHFHCRNYHRLQSPSSNPRSYLNIWSAFISWWELVIKLSEIREPVPDMIWCRSAITISTSSSNTGSGIEISKYECWTMGLTDGLAPRVFTWRTPPTHTWWIGAQGNLKSRFEKSADILWFYDLGHCMLGWTFLLQVSGFLFNSDSYTKLYEDRKNWFLVVYWPVREASTFGAAAHKCENMKRVNTYCKLDNSGSRILPSPQQKYGWKRVNRRI